MKKIFFISAAIFITACAKTPEKFYEKGNKLYASGNYYAAIESYTKAIMLKNKFPQAITARGMAYEALGQRKKAADEYEKSIYVDKNYLPAYNNLAAIHIEGGNYKDASYYLEEALKINPNYNYALYSLGLIKFINKDYRLALYYFQKSVDSSPTDIAYYYLALAKEKLGEYEEAVEILAELFRKDPDNHLIAYENGRIRYQMGDYSAIEYLTAALQKAQKPEYYYYRAKVNFSLKDYAPASEDILKAIEMDGWKNSEYLRLAGDIAAAYGNPASARSYYDFAYRIHKNVELYKGDLQTLEPQKEVVKKRGRR
ncbi:MAG: tetratricopeptide repeat protein [Elusimicrobiota bacterium]